MPLDIDDVDEFTEPIQAPNDGDSASVPTITLAPQGLANRTRNLKNRLDALYGNAPVALEGTLELNDEDVHIEEDLEVGGATTLTGALTAVGGITAQSASFFGVLNFRWHATVLTNANLSVTTAVAQVIYINGGAGGTFTLTNSGRSSGDFHWFFNVDDNTATVEVEGGGWSASLSQGQYLVAMFFAGIGWQILVKGSMGL